MLPCKRRSALCEPLPSQTDELLGNERSKDQSDTENRSFLCWKFISEIEVFLFLSMHLLIDEERFRRGEPGRRARRWWMLMLRDFLDSFFLFFSFLSFFARVEWLNYSWTHSIIHTYAILSCTLFPRDLLSRKFEGSHMRNPWTRSKAHLGAVHRAATFVVILITGLSLSQNLSLYSSLPRMSNCLFHHRDSSLKEDEQSNTRYRGSSDFLLCLSTLSAGSKQPWRLITRLCIPSSISLCSSRS